MPPATGGQAASKLAGDGVFTPSPRPTAAYRLLCFPYAGGSSSTYARWAPLFDQDIELVCVDPPGRGACLDEPRIGDVAVLSNRLADALLPWLDRPFALLGHSNGALLAFELARRLRERGRQPHAFFASAKRAPSRVRETGNWHALPDDLLIAFMRATVGGQAEFYENRELLDLYLPTLRADLSLSETYRYQEAAPLDAHLVTLRGTRDHGMGDDDLAAWAAEFTGDARHVEIDGDHFFVDKQAGQFVDTVNRAIRAWLPPDGGA
ncbi:alpha/beta fold hydrolase [Paraburkholderia sp. A1RI_3L]|uniref:thioesterase II family protein n=1 Tax=Paraburkholderia TaxID=1822464 RepID=UPI003B79E20B